MCGRHVYICDYVLLGFLYIHGWCLFKKWIENQRAKERKRSSQNVVDGDQDVVPRKKAKGERKLAASSMFYRHLSKVYTLQSKIQV